MKAAKMEGRLRMENGGQIREEEEEVEGGLGEKERGAVCTGVNWGTEGEWERKMKRKSKGKAREGGMRKEGSFLQWQSRHRATVCLEGRSTISTPSPPPLHLLCVFPRSVHIYMCVSVRAYT